jgi:hypothetical protein
MSPIVLPSASLTHAVSFPHVLDRPLELGAGLEERLQARLDAADLPVTDRAGHASAVTVGSRPISWFPTRTRT